MTNEIKQFSYDALKSIVSFSELEKREQFSESIFSLKKIDALFPYHFDKITVGSEFVEIKIGEIIRCWQFVPVNPDAPNTFYRGTSRGENRDIEKFSHCTISLSVGVDRTRRNFELTKRYEGLMMKLLKEYLRKGSKVDVLRIYALPPNLAELGNVKLEVKQLRFDRITPDTFHPWLAVISDEEPFEQVKFVVCTETMFMIREPRIQSCTRLCLQFPYYDTISLEDWFANLPNQHVDVIHLDFPMEILTVMIRKWVNWRRPLGTTFTLGIQYYTTVLDAFDMAQAELKGKLSNFPEITNSYCTHCCTIPVDDQREVVIYGGRKAEKYPPFDWNLKVEVMKKGRTVPKQ